VTYQCERSNNRSASDCVVDQGDNQQKTGTNVMESYQAVENSGTVHDKLATQEFSSEEVIS
jgi:hypothetical protein